MRQRLPYLNLVAQGAVVAAIQTFVHAYADPVALRGRMAETINGTPSCAVDEKTCMRLLGVTIDGATALAASALSDLYQPYLTQPVDIDDIAAIALGITERYRKQGYVLSQAVAPEQDFSSGIARIVVVEGSLNELAIEGAGKHAVEAVLAPLNSAAPASLPAIDRALALAKDIPGVSLSSRVEPDINAPARHRLVADTELEKTEGFAQITNRGSDEVGPWQAFANYSFNSLWRPRDQLSFGLFTTPADPDEFTQVEAGYSSMFTDGRQLFASATVSEAMDGHDPASPAQGGDAITATLGYEYPLARSQRNGLWLGANFSAFHLEGDWQGGGSYRDELRVGRVMLRGYQEEAGAAAYVYLRGSLGLDALGSSGRSAINRSRFDADAEFVKLDFHTAYYRDLGSYFGIYASLDGQWSDGPLLQSEEFSVGGPRLGRAYNYGEIAGDDALGAVLEFRAGFDPAGETISFLQSYLFYDVAKVWNRGGADHALSSAGLGLRIDVDEWLTARMEFARPLTRTPYETNDRDWRNFLSLAVEY